MVNKIGFVFLILLLLLSCSTDQSIYGIEPDMLTWNLRGSVRDGLTGNGIGKAVVSYIDKDGKIQEIKADTQSGDFFVSSLDPGTYLFSVSSKDSAVSYTKTIIQTGVSLVDTGIPLVELAEIVNLYPRTGKISGIIKGRFFENGTEFPISNAQISVHYTANKYLNNTPTLITGKSDSFGYFFIDSLPICDSAILSVENCEYDGELYTSIKDYDIKFLINDTTPLGSIYMEPANSTSRFRFTYSNLCDVNLWKTYPTIDIASKFLFVTNKLIEASDVKLMKNSEQVPVKDSISNDSIWITPVSKLLPGTNYNLYLSLINKNGERIDVGEDSSKISFITDNSLVYVISSNILHSDLSGKSNLPLTVTPYFIFSSSADSNDLSIKYYYDNNIVNSDINIIGDTVFAAPKQKFPHNTEIITEVKGTDISGNKISIRLDNSQKFSTEEEIEAMESNTWTNSKEFASNFDLYDTLWVRYPAKLDSLITSVKWGTPNVSKKLFGNGSSTNTISWISEDTLFVIPDSRIQIGWGDTVGFSVSVNLADGRKTKTETFAVVTKAQTFSSLWSNTIDDFGKERIDFGLSENVIFKVSHSVLTIDKVYKMSDGSITLPEDIYKDDFTISGDTISFIPSLKYKTGTRYGFLLDVTLTNGMKLKRVLGTSWETREPTKIISANTHDAFGIYRPFRVYGDTFSVRFSQPIDTSITAPVQLSVTLIGSDYSKLVNSKIDVDSSGTIAKVTIQDTLATANAFPVEGYIYSSSETRSVRDVKFNFTTKDGEVAMDLKMDGKNIEIHTESGLCAINSNILESHKSTAAIEINETSRQLFNPDSLLYIEFSRPLDTIIIKQFDYNYFVSLFDYDDLPIDVQLSFSADLKTLYISPDEKLTASDRYYLEVKNIPALNISGSKGVNSHSGTYSGKAYRNRLISTAFNIASPIISNKVSDCYPENIAFSAVADNRIGCSAGNRDYSYLYEDIVGTGNVQISSALKFRIKECAWNENHNDSVAGYEVQIRKVDRYGSSTQWYNVSEKIETRKYSEGLSEDLSANITVRYESFYYELQTEVPEGQAVTYSNYPSMFNDSSTIQLRTRPYVGIDGFTNYRTGIWGEPVSITDNIAPCDSDFVTIIYCDNQYYGGVSVYEYVDFSNSTENVVSSGYIEIRFPEDMDVTGPSPKINFYYGTFEDDTTITMPLTVVSGISTWYTARTYRAYVAVPPGDYSNGGDFTGAFFNVSVAGCKDLSGIAIDTYGTDGVQAVNDLAIEERVNALDVTDHVKGSASISTNFIMCN